MARMSLGALGLAACGRIGFEPVGCESSLCESGYRRKLTIQNGDGEYLQDFPIPIVLDEVRFAPRRFDPAGSDLVFTDADGVTPLPFEIEVQTATPDLVVWVRVPEIDARSDLDHIWMYYGGPETVAAQDPTLVWDDAFVGVWHLGEDPAGSAPALRDSSRAENHGTGEGGLDSAAQGPGIVGGSVVFDGVDDLVRVVDDDSLDGMDALTIEAWIAPTWFRDYERFVVKGYYDESIPSCPYECYVGSYAFHALTDGTAYFNVAFRTSVYGERTIPLSAWTYVVATHSAERSAVFVNGVVDVESVETVGVAPADAEDLYIGADLDRNQAVQNPFQGRIDEVRISRTVRPSEWIAAQHRALRAGSDFVFVGPEEKGATAAVTRR